MGSGGREEEEDLASDRAKVSWSEYNEFFLRHISCGKKGSYRRVNGDVWGQDSTPFLSSFPFLPSFLPSLPPVLLSFLFKEYVHVV